MTSVALAQAGGAASFHVAATPAEKGLDTVLRLSEKDYNPLTCAQDESDKPYQYKTESTADGKAGKETGARFELLAEAGHWKINR